MTDGTSQGLFIVVAIVIFGIFVALSYQVFGDNLSNGIDGLFTGALEEVKGNLNYTLSIQAEQDDFVYTIDYTNNTAEIVRYIGSDTRVVIPNNIVEDGTDYPIVKIGDFAFYGPNAPSEDRPNVLEHALEKVTIPNTVKFVGEHAFADNNLVDLVLPVNLEHIGPRAFRRNKFTDVIIPNTVTYIGTSAFSENEIYNLKISNNLEAIGSHVFRGNNLEGVVIPDSVTSIGVWAFGRNNLIHVEIPSTVVSLGPDSFRENSLESIQLNYGLERIRDNAFRSNNITDLYIPESVHTIDTRTFRDNSISQVIIYRETTYTTSGPEATFDEGTTIIEGGN